MNFLLVLLIRWMNILRKWGEIKFLRIYFRVFILIRRFVKIVFIDMSVKKFLWFLI